jgi:hypothetical protein
VREITLDTATMATTAAILAGAGPAMGAVTAVAVLVAAAAGPGLPPAVRAVAAPEQHQDSAALGADRTNFTFKIPHCVIKFCYCSYVLTPHLR